MTIIYYSDRPSGKEGTFVEAQIPGQPICEVKDCCLECAVGALVSRHLNDFGLILKVVAGVRKLYSKDDASVELLVCEDVNADFDKSLGHVLILHASRLGIDIRPYPTEGSD